MPNDQRREPEQHQGDMPSDRESLAGETAASEPLTRRPGVQPGERDARATRDEQGRTSGDADADAAEQLGHS
jgi:hypothetical protein